MPRMWQQPVMMFLNEGENLRNNLRSAVRIA
jgi:hypothetical protein